MKNKKGFSIIELIVSLCLISVVMVLLYSLFEDVSYEANNQDYSYKNTLLKIEAEEYIHNNLNDNVDTASVVNNNNLYTITIPNQSFYITVDTTNGILKVLDNNPTIGVKRQWTLNDASFSKNIEVKDIKLSNINTCEIIIPVLSSNINNDEVNGLNNVMDDIVITYNYGII